MSTRKLNKKILLNLLIFIFLILIFAYVIEYKFGHDPCKLCLYQRIPYFISILLILKIFFIKGHERIFLFILSLVFISSSILAFYHFGIEQGFFKESLACTNESLSENLTRDELLKQLSENTISCKDVSLRIFGFSLASINTIFSIVLSGIFFNLFIKYEKN